jgi:hypothetical protein
VINLSLSVAHFFSSSHREHTEQSVPYRANVHPFIAVQPPKVGNEMGNDKHVSEQHFERC